MSVYSYADILKVLEDLQKRPDLLEYKEKLDNDEKLTYFAKSQAQDILVQTLESLHQKEILDIDALKQDMYPELWTSLVNKVRSVTDVMGFLLESTVEKIVGMSIAEEEATPLVAVGERRIQSEEDKDRGLMHIDQLVVPESLKQEQESAAMVPNINLIQEHHGKSIDEIITNAFTKTADSYLFPDEETSQVFFTNIVGCQILRKAIELSTVAIEDLENLGRSVEELTDSEFANIFMWEVFEMPEVIKSMMEQYREVQQSIQSTQKPNFDDEYIYIHPSYTIATMIDGANPAEVIALAFTGVRNHLLTTMEENKDTATAAVKYMNKTLLEDVQTAFNDSLLLNESIGNLKIHREGFKDLLLAGVEIVKNGMINEGFLKEDTEDDFINMSVFSIISSIFPQVLHDLTPEEEEVYNRRINEDSGKVVEFPGNK